MAEKYGARSSIVDAVIAANAARKMSMVEKIVAACSGSVRDRLIAVLGLTFKPNTDDMREAPSLVILPELMSRGARVRTFDPQVMAEARRLTPRLETADDPFPGIAGGDAMVILTEWDQFRALDLDRVKSLLRSPVVVDLRNIYKSPPPWARKASPTSASGATTSLCREW
jgi:UDPglucose 6-dehydrogenase